MLIATHGPDAETIVARSIEAANNEGKVADAMVWHEISKKLASIRADAAPSDPQP